MSNPAEHNITLQRRADHSFNINLKDSSGNNEDLSGKTILSQIWNESRTWKVTDTQTTSMTDNIYKYDILKIESNGDRVYFLEGKIFMSEGYTAQ